MEVRKLMYPEEYEKNGEKKTSWKQCGILFIKDDGNISMQLSSMPLSGKIMAFKEKEEAPKKTQEVTQTGEPISNLPF